jgi:hypothetical protein
VIGRLFGRKPTDDEASRSGDRLITSRDAKPAAPPDARANDARIDAALDAAVDTVSLSRVAQSLPASSAAPASPPESAVPSASGAPAAPEEHSAPEAPEQRTAPGAPVAPSASDAAGASPEAAPAFGREGGPDPWLADAFDRLLAEEQGEAPAAFYGSGYGLSDADLDRIAARVADRLARGGLGDTVTRIVTEVSERLVREEIARIRQSASAPSDDRP